ncbi:hypothetical protein RG903_09100 [Thermithiobacillus tepidarius DSM 3134]|uniref:hypothetical protein n=1 Tax=Thermithiobacillus tepidarius TaxID=929 RepID=UPI000409F972|nr:hypothetical protein [Thermithiobacillus tepidarius]
MLKPFAFINHFAHPLSTFSWAEKSELDGCGKPLPTASEDTAHFHDGHADDPKYRDAGEHGA